MTAEIAILNRSTIAMAADSAVTIGARSRNGRKRVWKSTNKLFSLSPENDIAVMIYGTGDFCGVPWETIIKLFSQHKNQRYGTVEKCKAEFIDFIKAFQVLDPDIEDLNSQLLILNFVEGLAEEASKGASKTESKEIFGRELARYQQFFDDVHDLSTEVALAEFSNSYGDLIIEGFSEGVSFTPSKMMKKDVVSACHQWFQRQTISGYETGLVFGGFGEDEFFPCLSKIIVDGKSAFGVRWWDLHKPIVMQTWKASSAYILPFGQGDIAHLFIEGIDEGYLRFMKATILGALGKKSQDVVESYVSEADKVVESELQRKEDEAALESIMNDFQELRRKSIVDPMLSVVRNLPKEEMAAMAESLVEITSLRRRMDSDVESVAGPVDVVVISKGDGPVWMKRKHYFDAAMNSDFASRRAARRKDV